MSAYWKYALVIQAAGLGRVEAIRKQNICLFRVAAFIKVTAVEYNPNETRLNKV